MQDVRYGLFTGAQPWTEAVMERMSGAEYEAVTTELVKLGMRWAHTSEAGWYVTLLVCGELRTVWATDR